MSYWTDCNVRKINYFSNPEVFFEGQATGTSLENNAQQIRDTMVRTSGLQHVHYQVLGKSRYSSDCKGVPMLLYAARCNTLHLESPVRHRQTVFCGVRASFDTYGSNYPVGRHRSPYQSLGNLRLHR